MWLCKRLVAMWMMVVFTTPLVLAEVPRIMTYQGRLTSSGAPYNGAKNLIFTIYNASGTSIWSSGTVSITLADGLFNVELGKSPQPPLPTGNWQTDTLLSLGITMPPDPELTQRYRFTTTGYAFTAKTADLANSIADNSVNSAKIVNGSILFQDLNRNEAADGTVIKWEKEHWVPAADEVGPSSGWTDAGSVIHNTTTADSVGIGTTTPQAKLDVVATGNQGDPIAVHGYSRRVDSYGIGGAFEGGYVGVAGHVISTGSSYYTAVNGYVTGGGGVNYGVYSNANGSGTNYGIYSTATGGTSWAGYFEGDVNVTGTIVKSASGFKIDHPLDPANRYLQHNSVESAEMKNIYDGVAVLDATGKVTVQLPDWFQALNGDFRYQLTCIGGYAPVYVASEVNNNQFEIAGGAPGLKVSWQITGVRQDRFAQAHRLPVEPEKLHTEKGRYLHPELYGLGEEQSVTYNPDRTPQERAKDQALRENLTKAADQRIPERPESRTVKATER